MKEAAVDFSPEQDAAELYRQGFDSDLEAELRLPIAKLETKSKSGTPTRFWAWFRFHRQEASAQ
jgi:hypothetical protein